MESARQSSASHSSNTPSESRRRTIEPIRYKTRMCRHYETTGHCPFAPRCAFAHGPEDLRTVVINANDGLTRISRLREFQDRLCGVLPLSSSGATTAPPLSTTTANEDLAMAPPNCETYIPGCQCPSCLGATSEVSSEPTCVEECQCPSCVASMYCGYPPYASYYPGGPVPYCGVTSYGMAPPFEVDECQPSY